MFITDAAALQAQWNAALAGLRANIQPVYGFDAPVLIEGGGYPGIWLECGPHEALVYAPFDEDVARAGHDVFFALQRQDGYLPCYVWRDAIGTGQIQMVVPIAATALEVVDRTGDEALLARAYSACTRWDEWLVTHRNTRGTGLCEIFCGYDTGHDNSPRFEGLPWQCPDADARRLPRAGALPYLGPDVSATMYGGRIALSKMAKHLGKSADEARWLEQAEALRQAILVHCFDPDDICFYDRDANDQLVRIRHDALTRVAGEHIMDSATFDELWRRHLGNPQRFWTPYPFPSVAIDDVLFDASLPENSWGGASQALTALRAPRWMEHYGRVSELTQLMRAWLRALCAAQAFMQQMNPWTGQMSTSTLLAGHARSHGLRGAAPRVRRTADGLEWGCALPDGATRASFRLPVSGGTACLELQRRNEDTVAQAFNEGRASEAVEVVGRGPPRYGPPRPRHRVRGNGPVGATGGDQLGGLARQPGRCAWRHMDTGYGAR
jgi:hypothetical protein